MGDAFHARSVAWFRRQRRLGRMFFEPAILLPELSGAVARVLDSTSLGLRAARHVMRLQRVHMVPLDEQLMVESFDVAARLRLRGADSIYAALARRLGVQLISWDKEQIARAGAVTP